MVGEGNKGWGNRNKEIVGGGPKKERKIEGRGWVRMEKVELGRRGTGKTNGGQKRGRESAPRFRLP